MEVVFTSLYLVIAVTGIGNSLYWSARERLDARKEQARGKR